MLQIIILLKESTSTAKKKKKKKKVRKSEKCIRERKKSATVQYANDCKKTDHSQYSMQIINNLMTF